MSAFLDECKNMIEELNDINNKLVFYMLNYESFGHETVIYRNLKKKFFIEFFYDGRDRVSYSISLARYYPNESNVLNLESFSINDLSKKAKWIGEEAFLSFDEEYKMLSDRYEEIIEFIPKKKIFLNGRWLKPENQEVSQLDSQTTTKPDKT